MTTTPPPRPQPPRGASTPRDRHRPRRPLPACGRAGTRRPRRPKRPGSVWLVAQHPRQRDARLVEPWLMETINRVVATYTRPGHRVLLLAPPTDPGSPAPDRATPGTRTGGGLLPALIEAARTTNRLGRTLEAVNAASDIAARTAEDAPPLRPQAVHRLAPESVLPAPTGHGSVRGRCGPTAAGQDRFRVVIAIVDPHDPIWVPGVSWGSLLAPSGILAFITHSDHQWGRLIDPTGLVTRAARSVGLAPVDRVVLLHIPVRDGALGPEPDLPAALPADGAPCAPAPRHTRVHADLLLFARARRAADHTGEDRR
ncbi:hypothetical protein ACFPH6_05425 [Streptomyces xiangluensis]|uniref:Uncharacterized protein n=1 Tax=Streptomyces xiangluensis TaxID=2665720 RepID=A0ABV8YFD8_9ACTN